jgi:DNA helicase-2/ATP-dependent DNA helicase PcrA
MADAAIDTETNTLLEKLNAEQRQAVEATEGAVLVLAGAGTGKTRVLITRIAHILMSRLAWPGEILAVTFTNKAAKEMSERIGLLVGGQQAEPAMGVASWGAQQARTGSTPQWLGTFHSIGAKIIRRHAEKLGLTSSFTILDTDDQLRVIKAILVERQIDEKSLPPKLFSAVIQSWKDQGLTPEKVTSGKDLTACGGHALEVYKAYQARLLQINATDFGDLILHMLTLFTQYPDVHQEYAKRFKYILVDEYQDTNVAQYLWLRLLAMGHKNICCVGDDDQSIYSWRGAEVGNILRFEKDFPDATVVRLECNYRSTPHILAAASAVIANNQGRFGKTLWTNVKEGEKIKLKSVWDEAEEARYIGEEIEDYQRKGNSLKDMAILVRAGFQTRAFEERFLTMGIAYRVVGGLRFYERAEIRDAIAYMRLITTPNDDLAFERIINTPKRGVGQATLQQIHTCARTLNISLFNATVHLIAAGVLKGKIGATLKLFIDNVAKWRAAAPDMSVSDLADKVIEESSYRNMWQQEKTPEAQGRLENLKELTRAIGDFETIEAFLEHVSLVTEAASENNSNEMVSVMTLHAAKGLEFEVVFLPGWEEGVFPHQRALDESGQKGLEEERRLAYVGMTRAKKRLVITHAANRRIYNQWQNSIPSRFIAEIPAEHVDKLSGGAYGRGTSGGNWASEVQNIMAGAGTTKKTDSGLSVGTRIFHIKFGYGRITAVNGEHLDIAFEKAGDKKVLADFVEKAS